MASSNRHWPSLFKSKPCNTHPHQWQHDVSPNSSLVSNGCLRTSPFPPSGVGGDKEERSPEPKPRWNPKPEQIRILEAIFNSGLVNPPRDEIRKIRAQLQEYGNVGDANVFYWFQNRKSRSKNKHRHRHLLHHNHHSPPSSAPSPTSSSSSDNNNNNKPASSTLTDLTTNGNIILGSAGGGNNNYSYATSADFFSTDNNAQFMFQGGGGVVAPTYSEGSSSMGFSELSNVVSSGGPSTNVILTELMMKDHHQAAAKMKMETQLMMSTYNTTTVSSASPNHTHITTPPSTATALHVPPPINLSQGVEEQGEMEEERPMILVFINDVAFQVCAGPFNLREAFGGDVVLFHSSGQPVLTNEWGDSLSSLQHGASYYLYYVEACQWEMKMDSINI